MPKLNNPGYDKMLNEFREFIARGNVIDLAVGVIIGGAFATITKSLTENIIMPIVGAIFGGVDFSNMFIRLGPVPAGVSATDYDAHKEAGIAMFGHAASLKPMIIFLLLPWIISQPVTAVHTVVL